MPKHVGPLPIVGTFGDVNFYIDHEGRNIARQKPGPSAHKVKHDPAFKRTRKHNAEFKRASQYGGLIRRAFRDMIRQCKDSTMHYKLVQRVYELMMMDKESEEGHRDLRSDTLAAFRHFELDSQRLSKEFFSFPIVTEAKNGVLEVSTAITVKKPPAGATAWKVMSIAAGIDFRNMQHQAEAQESAVIPVEGKPVELTFRHYYDEQLLLFHGMCIVFMHHDPVTDEYREVKERHVNAGWVRFVGVG